MKFFFDILLLVYLFTNSNPEPRTTSIIKGVVQNAAGIPIPGVKVILLNGKTNFTSGTMTDIAGEFSFIRVPVEGAYTFTFSTVGYETQTLTGCKIKEAATLSIIVKMTKSSGHQIR